MRMVTIMVLMIFMMMLRSRRTIIIIIVVIVVILIIDIFIVIFIVTSIVTVIITIAIIMIMIIIIIIIVIIITIIIIIISIWRNCRELNWTLPFHPMQTNTQIAWGPPGSCRPHVASCWPHKLCWQGIHTLPRKFTWALFQNKYLLFSFPESHRKHKTVVTPAYLYNRKFLYR